MLGTGKAHSLTNEEKLAFHVADMHAPAMVLLHKRTVVEGLLYTSQDYTRPLRWNNRFVKITCGGFGEIKRIISFTHEDRDTVVLLMRMFLVAQAFKSIQVASCAWGDWRIWRNKFSASQCTSNKCMCFQVKNKMLICTFPNARERLNYMIDSTEAKKHENEY